MNLCEHLTSIPEQDGHESFHDVFDITSTAEGMARMQELVARYPIFRGMYTAFYEHLRHDSQAGVPDDTLESIGIGFGMALAAVALVASSEMASEDIPRPEH